MWISIEFLFFVYYMYLIKDINVFQKEYSWKGSTAIKEQWFHK